jgi:acetylornithine deacetylase/succinyl-diaminopimelate desuccinylase-like protein
MIKTIVDIAQRLIAVPSPNPPGDTTAVAAAAADLLCQHVPSVEIETHCRTPGIVNLVARIRGAGPGRRIIFNGHLDTFPLGDGWSMDPLGGLVRDGKLYGRGAADMKGGIACSIAALTSLAQCRHLWRGEAVLTLAGDEETMGLDGTQYLLDTVPHATGDAVIIGDAGSPEVLRFGEKGFLWIEITAAGRAAHGAHVHLGINAIDRIRPALDVVSALEPVASTDEADTLQRITVNIGHIAGGISTNLVPAFASASADIRLPAGVSTASIESRLTASLGAIDGITWKILRRVEPAFTDPQSEIILLTAQAAAQALGHAPAVSMRVGASDARLFRAQNIPTVVYGPTPFNMGGPDEYVLLDDLALVGKVHADAAFAYLAAQG